MKSNFLLKLIIILSFLAVVRYVDGQSTTGTNINISGTSISSMIQVPQDFIRPPFPATSLQSYLQTLPVKSYNSKVIKYDGYEKHFNCYAAVLQTDLEITEDLIHGEHIIQYLRAQFLYKSEKYDMINYSYDDNRSLSFDQWGAGARFVWQDTIYVLDTIAAENYSYESFQKYMNTIFQNSSTNSIAMDTRNIDYSELSIGDVLVQPKDFRNRGHAVFVVDMAVHPSTGEKLVLLAQGYMPSQDLHILKNTLEPEISPWYRVNDESPYFATAQWTFRQKHARRFKINANALTFKSSLEDTE